MNGERLLLDTTFVVGYLNPRDQHHANALKCMPRVEKALDIVITEAVLIEIANLLNSTQHRSRSLLCLP